MFLIYAGNIKHTISSGYSILGKIASVMISSEEVLKTSSGRRHYA